MRIKHIFLQNFCKFYGSNVVDTDLYDRTEISGVNEVGKSTIKRVIQYIFGCRDENGKEISGIRPHDKDGNDLDGDITTEGKCYTGVYMGLTDRGALKFKGKISGTDVTWNVMPKSIKEICKADVKVKNDEFGKFMNEPESEE